MADGLVPIIMFLTIGAVLTIVFYLRYRTRHDIQTTVRSAIERGESLNPELIEALSMSLSHPYADLRRGIMSIAIGIAIFVFAGLVGDEDAEGALLAIAMFPLLVGIAYLGLWVFIGRKKLKEKSALQ